MTKKVVGNKFLTFDHNILWSIASSEVEYYCIAIRYVKTIFASYAKRGLESADVALQRRIAPAILLGLRETSSTVLIFT